MSTRDERKDRLRELAKQSKKKADEELADALQTVKGMTRADLESLRPKVSNQEEYARLITAVEEATARNESIADLKARIEKLGPAALDLAKEVSKLLEGR